MLKLVLSSQEVIYAPHCKDFNQWRRNATLTTLSLRTTRRNADGSQVDGYEQAHGPQQHASGQKELTQFFPL